MSTHIFNTFSFCSASFHILKISPNNKRLNNHDSFTLIFSAVGPLKYSKKKVKRVHDIITVLAFPKHICKKVHTVSYIFFRSDMERGYEFLESSTVFGGFVGPAIIEFPKY